MSDRIKIVKTHDGSNTIMRDDLQEHYHSIHGAMQESRHVFIKNGLDNLSTKNEAIRIFEMGFGTGLNALMTLEWAHHHRKRVSYYTVENHLVPLDVIKKVGYAEVLYLDNLRPFYEKMHTEPWEIENSISPYFNIVKLEGDLLSIDFDHKVDLIYYDAFSPNTQPELWTEDVFRKLYGFLDYNGSLVTYCAKGYVRRNLQAAGFQIEKLPGPPGKREMLRGTSSAG